MATSSSHPLRDRLPTYVPNADWHSDHTKASFASAATYHHLKQSSSILRTSVLFLKIAFSTPPDPRKKNNFKRTMMTLTLRSTCVAGFVCAGIG